MRRAIRLAATILLAAVAWTGAALAQQPFYAGKTLTIVAGTSAGGYYDIAARTVARHIGRFIDGHPSTVVQNDPVGGGLGLGNRLAHTMARDGTFIAVFNRALPQLALAGEKNAQFEPLDLTWLGSLSSYKDDAYLMVLREGHPAKSFGDVNRQPRPVHLGGTRAGATNIVFALMAHDMLKLNVDLVRGFPGAAEIWLAMERGELDGQIADISAIMVGRPTLWKEKKLAPIVAFGRTERLPDYPDVPIAREFVRDPDDLALLEFAEMPFFMALPFAAPPGLPPERAQVLKDAFMKMARDAEFRADMLKAGILTSPIDGAAVRDLIVKAAGVPLPVRQRFLKLLNE